MGRLLTLWAGLLVLSPTFADVVHDGELRVLRIRACADDELRTRDGWVQEVAEHLAFASNFYEKTFGVRFDVVETVEWESDDAGEGMGDLVDELETEISLEGADVVIGFSAQPPGRGKLSKYISLPWGLTPSLGRVCMVRAMIDDESYDLHLALVHEIAHLFGAFHVQQQDSVMRETVEGPRTFQFDVENGKLMRLQRDYDFEAGVEGLSKKTAGRITELWRRGTVEEDNNPLAEALYNRGIDLMNQEREEEALALWERSAEADDTFAAPRGVAGMTLADMGRYEEAMQELEAAQRLGWPDAGQIIALIQHEQGSANKAGLPEASMDKGL